VRAVVVAAEAALWSSWTWRWRAQRRSRWSWTDDAAVSRKYSLNLSAWATNVLNHENFGTPNGVLAPELNNGVLEPGSYFDKSQSLAGQFFGSATGGNRSIQLQANFNF